MIRINLNTCSSVAIDVETTSGQEKRSALDS